MVLDVIERVCGVVMIGWMGVNTLVDKEEDRGRVDIELDR